MSTVAEKSSTPFSGPNEANTPPSGYGDEEKPPVFATLATGALDEGEPPVQQSNHVGPPPDGGFRAWLTVLGSFFAVFTQFGLVNSFGVFQAYYSRTLLKDHAASSISWIGTIQLFIMFAGGLFVGRLFDAHGAHILLIPGTILLVLSLMMVSLCTEYYQIMLAQGLMFGVGSACVWYPAITVPGQWFARRRALAMAIAGSSSGLGGTVWPIALDRLIKAIGFPWAIRTTAFISLLLLVIANFLIRTRLPRKKPTPLSAVREPLKERSFVLLQCCVAGVFWGLFPPFFYSSQRLLAFGGSTSLAFYCVSFLNAGSTIGRLVAGVGDRVGGLNVLTIAAFACAILHLAFWIPLQTQESLIGFCLVYGGFTGLVISIIPACVAATCHPSEIGFRFGLGCLMCSVFSLTGAPIAGAIIAKYPGDLEMGFTMAGVFSGVCAFIGGLCGIGAKLSLDRRWMAKV